MVHYSLNALKTFDALARCGDLSKAAETLFVTRQAVFKQIATLEDQLGAKLVIRSRGTVQLTLIGNRLASVIGQSFENIDKQVHNLFIRAEANEVVRISVCNDFASGWLIKNLVHFRMKYPHIDVRLYPVNNSDMIMHEDFDYRIRYRKPDQSAKLGFLATRLCSWYDILCCSPFLVQRYGSGEGVLDKECLFNDRGYGAYFDWRNYSVNINYTKNVKKIDLDNMTLCLAAVRQNIGFTFCDNILSIDEITKGELATPFPVALKSISAYYLYKHREIKLTSSKSKFESWLVDAVSDHEKASVAQLKALGYKMIER